jgi:hypothetical protein
VLQAEEKGEQDGDLVVKPVEWRVDPFVLSVQRPDVGGDQIKIVLEVCQCIYGKNARERT